MKRLLIALTAFLFVAGLFYVIGPPMIVIRLLLDTPGFWDLMCETRIMDKLHYPGFGSACDTEGILGWGYRLGLEMRFWASLTCGGISFITMYLLSLLWEVAKFLDKNK